MYKNYRRDKMLNYKFKKNLILCLIGIMIISCTFVGCNKKETNQTVKKDTVEESKKTTKKEEVTKEKETEKKEYVFKLGVVNPENHPFVMSAFEFGRILEEKSNGRLKLEIFPSGQLGDLKTMLQSAQMGALDMAMSKPGTLLDYNVKKVGVLNMPYIFRDLDHAWNVLEGDIGEELLDEISKAGSKLVGIGYYEESPRNFFFTDKDVQSLDDLKGLKIRVMSSEIYADIMEAFGASATPIAYSELYSALQSGVVDGAENPLSGYYTNKFHEVAKYYVLDGHEAAPTISLFSEVVWSKLSDEDKQLIKESMLESQKYQRKLSEEKDIEIMQNLKDEGVKITEIKDKTPWINAMKPIYEKHGKGIEDLIKNIQNVK